MPEGKNTRDPHYDNPASAEDNSNNSHKVMVIGLDGAAFDLVNTWCKDGHLPNLSRIMGEGCYGVLNSVVPPYTAPAWVSYLTGKHPGNHGIFYFLNKEPSSYQFDFFNRRKIIGETLDAILTRNNRRIGLLNVPCTYPPQKVNGFVISGLGTPSEKSNFTYPEDLQEEITRRFDYHIEPQIRYRKGIEDEYINTVNSIEDRRYEVMKYLMRSLDWDLFSVVFSGTDLMGHFFWRFMDKSHPSYDEGMASRYGTVILDYYKKMDRIVGNIYDDIKDKGALILISDHGMGPHHKIVYLDNLFREWGLLESSGGFFLRLKKLLSFVGLSPETVHKFLLYAGLRDFLRKRIDNRKTWNTIKRIMPVEVDWKRTKAFPFSGTGLIYINVRGRDPEGIVEPGDEYDQIVQFIRNKLLDLRDRETGARIVRAVKSGDDVYPGHKLVVPDLYVEWADDLYKDFGMIGYSSDRISKPLVDRSGNHNARGIFMAAGKDIGAVKEIIDAQIIDLAPTILHILGVPIPGDMDGMVLHNIFQPGSVLDHEPLFEDGQIESDILDSELTDEEREMIRDQLKRLGYL